MAGNEFNITVTHATSGKELVLAVAPDFTVSSVLEVLVENLKLKDRFVLATADNKILDGDITLSEAGVLPSTKLVLMPDPTGGRGRATGLAF